MQNRNEEDAVRGVRAREGSESIDLEVLIELGRATTAYHEAPPDRVEYARQEYEEALRNFNAARDQY